MDSIFALRGNEFRILSLSHISPLLLIFSIAIIIFIFRYKLNQNPGIKKSITIIFPILVFIAFTLQFLWIISRGYFNVKYSLPLHLCDITFMLVFFLFLFPHKYMIEIMYFIGIGGALQAVLTPALAYDFPHINYLFFFSEHGLVILCALYFVFIDRRRMTIFSLLRAFLFFNLTGIIVLGCNLLLGSNYMFIMRKPAFPSLFDLLGPWPVYLVVVEGIAIITFGLLYLPFLIKKKNWEKSEISYWD